MKPARINPRSETAASELPDGAVLAAIDLGSNSFHLIIARVEHEEVRIIETLSEKVQLGAGLRRGELDAAAIQRGIACLSQFKQMLDSVSPFRLRIVGTNALRQARNRRAFTIPAETLLGAPVEVIYGSEEARLVYLGVAHTLADDGHSRLVIDIGGGSTEFIIGTRFEPQRLESVQMGCVSYTGEYFGGGRITAKRYRNAYEAARREVNCIRRGYHADCWQDCVGSSGTLQAIEAILLHFKWTEAGITRGGLRQLEDALLSFRHIDGIDIESLSDARRNVILAGVAIAAAIFDELEIPLMRSSRGALREGVIYDLLGRLSHEDVRERTVQALMRRYAVDEDIAAIVSRRARVLFLAARDAWGLGDADWDLLRWAALTHEVGMGISHKHYNRHSAYLLRHADLPGFSQDEQEALAALAWCHRRQLPAREFSELWDAGMGAGTGTGAGTIADASRARLLRLAVLLRLANLFKYVEQLEELPEFQLRPGPSSLALQFPPQWLKHHPLTARELQDEQSLLKRLNFKLRFD